MAMDILYLHVVSSIGLKIALNEVVWLELLTIDQLGLSEIYEFHN